MCRWLLSLIRTRQTLITPNFFPGCLLALSGKGHLFTLLKPPSGLCSVSEQSLPFPSLGRQACLCLLSGVWEGPTHAVSIRDALALSPRQGDLARPFSCLLSRRFHSSFFIQIFALIPWCSKLTHPVCLSSVPISGNLTHFQNVPPVNKD